MDKEIKGLGDLTEEEFKKYQEFREQKDKEELARKEAIADGIGGAGRVIWYSFLLLLLLAFIIFIFYVTWR